MVGLRDPRFLASGRDAEAFRALKSVEAGEPPAAVARSLIAQGIAPLDAYKILRAVGLTYEEAQGATSEVVYGGSPGTRPRA